MAEELILTVPEVKTNRDYRVIAIYKHYPDGIFHVDLRGTNGEHFGHEWRGDIARTFIRALNTANLSIKSEERRILDRLVLEGIIVGTVQGSPDA